MSMFRIVLVACFIVGSALLVSAQVQSGLQPGDKTPGFEVIVATGPDAADAKKRNYLKEKLKDKPVLLIFVHRVSRPGFRLLKVLDRYGEHRKGDGLAVMVVRLSNDMREAVRYSKLMETNYGIKAVGTVSADGAKGPPSHGLNDRAEMTVLLLDKDHKVVHNTARADPQEKDFEPIRAAIDKLLGQPAQPFEP
ncbi:MAG: hypothetical protein HY000_33180 [Planctomycetes bacterium]|nr:hypothetical protein [Planctomycetota bacterium]